MGSSEQATEIWEGLYKSNDIHADLTKIYSDEFLENLTVFFDKSPHSYELIGGVHGTVIAYLNGKRKKAAFKRQLLQNSGMHLLKAGVAAQELQYSLKQLSKSPIAEGILYTQLEKFFKAGEQRGIDAYEKAAFRNGPDDPMAFIRDLSSALSRAADAIVTLPDHSDTESHIKQRTDRFVAHTNAQLKEKGRKPSANHALEEAAKAFRPTWEKYSTKLYSRGRYHHNHRGYASDATMALHKIISRIDPQVPETRAGTAIENIRKHVTVD